MIEFPETLKLKKVSDVVFEIPTSYKPGMRVPVRVVASEKILREMEEEVFNQIANVASLPGVVGFAHLLPDAHVGYGMPIGGVAAFDPEDEGIIAPGMVGYDINCGVRLIRTDLTVSDLEDKIKNLVDLLFSQVPSGVGSRGFLKLGKKDLEEVMTKGARWCVEKGLGWKEDLEKIEDKGEISGADPTKVSQRAIERGLSQLGTLGSGNHYLEIGKVSQIFDEPLAEKWGIFSLGQIVIMVHCGSRGFGHQVGTDYLRIFENSLSKYKISVPDRQLACAPFLSSDGQNYFGAMNACANLAFANRQLITHQIRRVFEEVFGKPAEKLGLNLIYDVAHNIAKVEEHKIMSNVILRQAQDDAEQSRSIKCQMSNVKKPARLPQTGEDGVQRRHQALMEVKKLVVHRKGATRSFPGQPVIVGGSMETGGYLMVGTEKALKETFGSTCHGSGRIMSRQAAKRQVRGEKLREDLEERGIYVRTYSYSGLAEEASLAYKNIAEVVETVERAGLSKRVVSFVPIGNIKG